jgi:hypothetical protein
VVIGLVKLLPGELLTLVFDVADDAAGSTDIGFSTSSTPVGYGFSGDAIAIDLIESPLSIDSATGEVTLSENPDFEAQDSYAFTVVATDAAGNASAPQVVTLAVNEVNDAVPAITSADTAAAIDENSGAGQVVYTATAQNSSGTNDGLTFSLSSDSDTALTIDSDTGTVSLTTDPDFEVQDSYAFTVIATDAADNASAPQAVTLSINNLDEVAPTITSGDSATAIDENSGEGQVVYTATASDTDFNGAQDFTFSLADDAVYTTTVPSVDAPANTQLVSVASYSSQDANGQITVKVNYNADSDQLTGLGLRIHFDSSVLTVADINNVLDQDLINTDSDAQADTDNLDGNASTDSYVTVAWASLGGDWPSEALTDELLTLVFDVADDAAGSTDIGFSTSSTPVGYGFSGDAIAIDLMESPLSIDSATGEVTLSENPDFDSASEYSFSVIATDAAGNESAPQAVTLAINEVDDVPPVITSADTAATIDENSGAGQVVYTATVEGSDPAITFSLSSDSDAALTIDSATGAVSLTTDPDFEAQDSYAFTVIATDAAGNESAPQAVTLAINEVDDVPPVITSADTAATIDENSGAGQVVYTATVEGSDPAITFSLSSDSDTALTIDSATGAVSLTTDPDFEAQDSYAFTVVATDAAGNASAPQAVTLSINNLDEVAPSITSGAIADAIDENSGTGQVVYTATASDTDFNGAQDFTFSLADDAVYTTTVPSVDAPANTQLVSVASYSSQDANGQITVKVNYNADSDQLTGLGLRIHFDSSVLTVADINNVLEQDLIDTDSDAQADTDNLDGNASTDSYVTVAWASLGGDWPSEALTDELLTLVFDVADDAAGSTDIGFSTSSTPVGYGFSGDAIAIDLMESPLSIDSATGEVTLSENPDFDSASEYSFSVIATDAAGNESAPQAVTLAINEVDDVPPVITSADTAATIDENSGAGQVVYTATVEGSDPAITFSLSSDSDAALTIDSATGAVSLTTDPDFEVQDSYAFTVIATDTAGNESAPQAVTLSVNNLDEVAPTITSADTASAIDENSGAGQVVYTATASDADFNGAQDITFSLADDAVYTTTVPSVDAPDNTQLVSVASYSSQDANGQITVKVNYNADSDQLTGLGLRIHFDSSVLTVADINNVLDQDLIDTDSDAQADTDNLDGNASTDSYVTVAWASLDGDWPGEALPGELLTLVFDVADDAAGSTDIGFSTSSTPVGYGFSGDAIAIDLMESPLSIDSATGEVTLSENPDFEAQDSYAFTVVATDAAGNASAPQVVTLAVNEVNDAVPAITSADTAATIDENSGAGQVVYTATAQNSSGTNDGLTFSLSSDSDTALTIDSATGAVSLTTDPDFEVQDSYAFTVIATDTAGNESAPQAVTLSVNNLDEVAPTITSADTASAIDENSGAGQVVYTATASDADFNGAQDITFSLADDAVYTTTVPSVDAPDNTQLVSVASYSSQDANGQITVKVNYNADSDQLTGLGLRIHFDSSVLTVADINNVLEQDLIDTDSDAQADTDNLDGNASTDSYVTVAWASLGGDWPSEALTDELLTLVFDVADDAAGSTDIGFSTSSTPVGYGFSGDAIAIDLIESPLSIDSATGEVTLSENPDFDLLQDSYAFTVVATDAAGNASAPQAVTLAINEVDDVPPVITSADTAATIDENSGAGQVVYTATVEGSDPAITFSLSSDSDAALTIDSATGAVSLTTDPDFEVQDSYAFTVIATDTAGNESAPQAVTLSVNNLDEVAPTITSADTASAIDENSGAGQVVYTATASDADFNGAQDITFSLADDAVYTTTVPSVDAPDNTQLVSVASYSSQDANGQITVKVNYNADSDQLTGLGLRIHFDSSVLTVADINNVLDQDLIDTDSDAQADTDNLDGNASTDSYVTVAWASVDGDWPSEALTDELLTLVFDVADDAAGSTDIGFSTSSTPVGYGFSGDAIAIDLIESPLSIDSATGEVTLSENPDFEVQDSYAFTVVATDAAGNASAPQAVTLAINEVDDVPPVITSADTAATIDENSGAGQVVYTATVEGSDPAITFSLSSDSDAALTIDSATGAVSLTTDPDFEVQDSYAFTVIATDTAGNESAPQAVTLSINNLDEVAPTITSADTASAIDENSGAGQVVYTATASDADFNGAQDITFSLADDAVYTTTVPSVDAPANTQLVSVASYSSQDANGQITVKVNYNADSDQLTGLGLRIHFDSSVLTVADINNVLDQDLINTDSDAQADTDNLDGNASTDSYVTVAWASLGGDWPGEALTDELLTLVFDVADDAAGSTDIGFSTSSTPVGYGFSGDAIAIDLIESPLSIDSATGEVTLSDNPDFEAAG